MRWKIDRSGGEGLRLRQYATQLALLLAMSLLLPAAAAGQSLRLPPRSEAAPSGSALAGSLRGLELDDRERVVFSEIAAGNIPGWLRVMIPVTMTRTVGGEAARVTFWASPDYLAIGSYADYLLMPLSPQVAQRLADLTESSLPTPPMVDAIWRAAKVRPGPDSIPPSAAMVTMPVFESHNATVRRRRLESDEPSGALVAGHKKDVVLSRLLDSLPGRVAIYGWHLPSGEPVQPLWVGHTRDHVDYSHGIRLVSRRVVVNGVDHDLVEVLQDSLFAAALSDEGAFRIPRYQGIEEGH